MSESTGKYSSTTVETEIGKVFVYGDGLIEIRTKDGREHAVEWDSKTNEFTPQFVRDGKIVAE